jgi:hypothetical protein
MRWLILREDRARRPLVANGAPVIGLDLPGGDTPAGAPNAAVTIAGGQIEIGRTGARGPW